MSKRELDLTVSELEPMEAPFGPIIIIIIIT